MSGAGDSKTGDSKINKPLTADEYAAQYSVDELLFGEWMIQSATGLPPLEAPTAAASAPADAVVLTSVQLTLWNDGSMKCDTVGRSNGGKTAVLADQSGLWSVLTAPATGTGTGGSGSGSGLYLRIALNAGTEIRNSGDVFPLYSEIAARAIVLPLHAFGREWKRCDADATLEVALARAVAARTKALKQPQQTATTADTKSVPAVVVAVPIASSNPAAVAVPAAAARINFAPAPIVSAKPESDARGRPSAAGRAKLAIALIARLTPGGSTGGDMKTVASGASAGAPILRCSDVFHVMSSHGTFLSEFSFFVRFYLSANLKINGDLFAASELDTELFPVDNHSAWKLMMKSKLSEFSGCGNFSAVFRDFVYFADRKKAAAALVPAITKPEQLIAEISDPKNNRNSYLIRIEWSSYNATEWAAAKARGVVPAAGDFHSYLIDIPALVDGQSERVGAIVQSLWYHYDSSVQFLPLAKLLRHFQFLTKFDGKTPFPAAQHYYWTGQSFYGAPLSSTRPSGSAAKTPELTPSQHEQLGVSKVGGRTQPAVINKIDCFAAYRYSQPDAVARIAQIIKSGFGSEATLNQSIPYGRSSAAWNRVLNVVFDVNVASEQAAVRSQLFRMQSIGNFLSDSEAESSAGAGGDGDSDSDGDGDGAGAGGDKKKRTARSVKK